MRIIIIAIVVLVAWFLFWKLPVNGLHYQTSSGNQTGYISAVEREGVIWKTNRVYIKPTLESTQKDIRTINYYKPLPHELEA